MQKKDEQKALYRLGARVYNRLRRLDRCRLVEQFLGLGRTTVHRNAPSSTKGYKTAVVAAESADYETPGVLAEEKAGHRQRLRDRFLVGEEGSRSEEALLELPLSYAIPQRDVQPLASNLIVRFGNLDGVLGASPEELCGVDGIKAQSATLLKLADWIRTDRKTDAVPQSNERQSVLEQPALFELSSLGGELSVTGPSLETLGVVDDSVDIGSANRRSVRSPRRRQGAGLFGKAILKEAIEMLPHLPDSRSLDEVKAFLRGNLHFSAETTRQRNADYIVERMFPDGQADDALRLFARAFAGQQTLRDVSFYRFCKAESLVLDVVEELLLPAIGAGRLDRERLRDYLRQRFPDAAVTSVRACALAITKALVDGGILHADREHLTFAYREMLLPSFAFVVHSEFPTPGMYDITALENSPAIRAMLWSPDRLLTSLYELRNQGLIAKVSEIDNVRQFTIRWNLSKIVERLIDGKART